jgi:hypothetical protein
MTGFESLWLPIVLSAVFVFLASAVIHMALPWRKNDFRQLQDQDRFMEALRPLAVPPGDYMVPRADSMKDMRTPEFQDKLNKGPVMVVTVLPNGPVSMGRSLGLWFVYCLIVSFFAAYIAGRALGPGSPGLAVFRFSGATAFIAYSVALWHHSIWYSRFWLTTFKDTVDGLVYAIITAASFAWLWPRLLV